MRLQNSLKDMPSVRKDKLFGEISRPAFELFPDGIDLISKAHVDDERPEFAYWQPQLIGGRPTD